MRADLPLVTWRLPRLTDHARDNAAWQELEVDGTLGDQFKVFCGSPSATTVGSGSSTVFGVVASGEVSLSFAGQTFTISAGMYFCVPDAVSLDGAGVVFRVEQLAWRGFFHLGGPIEEAGRLKYIDGCTDSLLISPPIKGDSCLNLLHIPPGTTQSSHTHPSFRIGVVFDGAGDCAVGAERHSLEALTAFFIGAGVDHHFKTEDHHLRVVAFHPDSDFGPDNENHPMLNRTVLKDDPKGGSDTLHS